MKKKVSNLKSYHRLMEISGIGIEKARLLVNVKIRTIEQFLNANAVELANKIKLFCESKSVDNFRYRILTATHILKIQNEFRQKQKTKFKNLDEILFRSRN